MTPVLLGLTGLKRSGKDTAAARLSQHYGFTRVAFADPVRQVLSMMNPVVEMSERAREVARPSQGLHEISRMSRLLEEALQRYTVGVDAPRELYVQAIATANPLLAEGTRLNDYLAHVKGDWDQLKEGSETVPAAVVAEVRRLMQKVATEAVRDVLDPDLWLKTALAAAETAMERGSHAVITDCRFDNEARAIKDAGGTMVQIVRPSVQRHANDQHISERGIDPSLIDHWVVNSSTIDVLDMSMDALMKKMLSPA